MRITKTKKILPFFASKGQKWPKYAKKRLYGLNGANFGSYTVKDKVSYDKFLPPC